MKPLAYLLEPDMHLRGCWELGEVSRLPERTPIPAHFFRRGAALGIQQSLTVALSSPGREIPFTMAAFDVPVVGSAIAAILRELVGDVQLVPLEIDRPVMDSYCVVNTLRTVDAIDTGASRLTRWEATDGRPEKMGSIRMITDLVLRADALRNAPEIFRLAGWVVPLIVRTDLAARLRVFEGLDPIPVQTA